MNPHTYDDSLLRPAHEFLTTSTSTSTNSTNTASTTTSNRGSFRARPRRAPPSSQNVSIDDNDNSVMSTLTSTESVRTFRELASGTDTFEGSVIDPNSIERISRLGSGVYGEVWSASYCGDRVAVKIPRLKRQLTGAERRIILKEIQVLSEKRHPNILLLMGAVVDDYRCWLVTELLECDLRTFLKSRTFSFIEKIRMTEDIARGMNWLHNHNECVLHLDLKLDNVLVDKNEKLKVADFGFAVIKRADVSAVFSDGVGVGNLLHKAPELIRDEMFNELADVYSFGILAWEVLKAHDWDGGIARIAAQQQRRMSAGGAAAPPALYQNDFLVAGRTPNSDAQIDAPPAPLPHFAALERQQQNIEIEREFKSAVLAGRRPPLTADIAPMAPLLARCWLDAPHRRPPFSEVLPLIGSVAMRVSLANDVVGVQLWCSEFGEDVLEVPWGSFRVRFYASLHLPLKGNSNTSSSNDNAAPLIKSPALFLNEIDEYMRAVLQQDEAALPADANPPGVASAIEFGRFLAAFGPMPDGSDGQLSYEWLLDVKRVVGSPWFYGKMSATEAIKALRGQCIGTYLVRYSSDPSVPFTISVVTAKDQCQHIRVHRVRGVHTRLYTLQKPKQPLIQPSIMTASIERVDIYTGTESLLNGNTDGSAPSYIAHYPSIADLVENQSVRTTHQLILPCNALRTKFQALGLNRMSGDYHH